MNNCINPSVRRRLALSTTPLTFIIPAGQCWEITRVRPLANTALQIFYISVDGEPMLWSFSSTRNSLFLGNRDKYFSKDLVKSLRVWDGKTRIIADEGQALSFVVSTGTMSFDIEYKVWGTGAEINRLSIGGTEGKERFITSICQQVTSIGAGATTDVLLNTNSNPAGATQFPWGITCPPARSFKLYGMFMDASATVGTNLTITGVRLTHDGKELITPTGVVTLPEAAMDTPVSTGRVMIFDEPYLIQPYEALALYLQVTSTDAGAQNATLEAGLMLDEVIKEK